MASPRRLVAHRHFPGPQGAHGLPVRLRAAPIILGRVAPAVYRIEGLTRAQFKSLYHRIIHWGRFFLPGPSPRRRTDQAVLVFSPPQGSPPLCLSAEVLNRDSNGFYVDIEPPSLSWRIGAVRLAQRLPDTLSSSTAGVVEPAQRADIRGRYLRMRPDLPGPAKSIAPTDELRRLVTSLRAGHRRLDSLVASGVASKACALPFAMALAAADIIVDAPRPLSATATPFEFLGLHWSAHDRLIRNTYRHLRSRLLANPPPDGADLVTRLDDIADRLRDTDARVRLRCDLVPPPVLGEVTAYFRHRLRRALSSESRDDVIDLCRRILELEPADGDIRAILRHHLDHR